MNIDHQIGQAHDKWMGNCILRYSDAYIQAYNKYKEVADAQEKATQAQMEMFSTIVSIMSTSIIMAAFAGVSFERMAIRAGLKTLGKENTRSVLQLFAAGQANPVVSFAVGKFVDMAKDGVSSKAKDAIGALMHNTAGGVSAIDPLNRQNELTELVLQQQICVRDCYDSIAQNSKLSNSQQQAQMEALLASPFFNPPSLGLDKSKLADKILLGMLMQKVLDGDHMETWFPGYTNLPPKRGANIDLMPSDSKYPRSQPSSTSKPWEAVEIDRPGGEFQKAINETHKKVFNTTFYDTHWYDFMNPVASEGQPAELQKAEAVLNRLSRLTRPRAPGLIAT